MRVVFLLLAFGTGLGFIGYVVAWFVMPKDYGQPVTAVVPAGATQVRPM